MLKRGDKVTWHYRSAIGHGTIVRISKLGKTAGETRYAIKETDHHVSKSGSREKSIVFHYGKSLRKVT